MPIVTLSEGGVSELHADLKGAMNALFLQDLGAKTHRGVRSGARGHVEAGRADDDARPSLAFRPAPLTQRPA